MMRARCSIQYGSGSPGVMTMYGVGPAEDTTECQILESRLKNAISAWLSLFSSATTTFRHDGFVDVIDPATGALQNRRTTAGGIQTPTAGGGQSPPVLALCVNWLTSTFVGGRRVRGRTFLSPLAGGVADANGLPLSAVQTAANNGAAQWILKGATAVDTVVWHRPKGIAPGSTAVVTGTALDPKFAVLRSRRD